MTTKKSIVWQIVHTSAERRIFLYFLLFLLQIIIFTIVFHVVYPLAEGKTISWAQSFMFVAETITTTGYGDLLPFQSETMNLLSAIMMFTGVIMIFMVIPLLITPYLVSVLRAVPPRRPPRELFGHTIIIGDGELSRTLVETLLVSDKDILLVEKDEKIARELAKKNRKHAFVIWGDYDDPQTWEQACVRDAAFVIISEDERTTASIILGIRSVTKAQIISIVDKIGFARYLKYAGAEYVLSPKEATGRILARHAVLNPTRDTASLIPGLDRLSISRDISPEKELRLIHLPVMAGSPAAGKTLGSMDLFTRYGILVLYMWKAGRFISRPEPAEVIDTTTSLFLFGRAGDISRAIRDDFEIDIRTMDHAVIAGFGDVGSAAYDEMTASKIPCVVVDGKQYNVSQVMGNAEDEGVLKNARIESARFCIVALNDDHVNIFTTLMARNLNPGIRLLARANEPESVDKLYRAGADYVALLPMIGGQTIGRIVLADTVTILLHLPDGEMVALKHIRHKTTHTVRSAEGQCGVRIIGIEGPDRVLVAPRANEQLHEGDSMIVTGNTERLKKFIRLFS